MRASIAQLVEHRSRKAGVTSSSLVAGSIATKKRSFGGAFFLSRPSQAEVMRGWVHGLDEGRGRPHIEGFGRLATGSEGSRRR